MWGAQRLNFNILRMPMCKITEVQAYKWTCVANNVAVAEVNRSGSVPFQAANASGLQRAMAQNEVKSETTAHINMLLGPDWNINNLT